MIWEIDKLTEKKKKKNKTFTKRDNLQEDAESRGEFDDWELLNMTPNVSMRFGEKTSC